jgi:hypothetical protein
MRKVAMLPMRNAADADALCVMRRCTMRDANALCVMPMRYA